jgi:hypothetical protein
MATIYRPRHQRQINPGDPYGKYNCTAYSAAIAVDRATLGGSRVTGEEIRAASSEPRPRPSSPGLNLPQATAAAFKATRVSLDVRRTSWTSMLLYIKNRGIILQGDYDQMGSFSCQTSFKGAHAVFLNNLNSDPVTIGGTEYGSGKAALTYDPLCTDYKWEPLTTLRKYAEKFTASLGYSGVLYATTRITPLIA